MFVISYKKNNNDIIRNINGSKMFFYTEDKAFNALSNQINKEKLFVRKAISTDYKKAHKKRTIEI